jgi:hypothetical protein
MRPITLVIVFADRQAPGVDEATLERLVHDAWGPLLDALYGAPSLRAGLVLSGALGRHIEAQHPEHMTRLKIMAARGQLEVIGGPSHGALLHLIAERDAITQVRQHMRWLAARTAVPVRGAWPPGGAWDPSLPRIMAKAGAGYTFVDAGLAAATGAPSGDGGWLVTEREGAVMPTIPLDHALGALLPFESHDNLTARLQARAEAGARVLALPISIESLGADAISRDWCWEGATPWVPELLLMLNRQGAWLKTAVPWQLIDRLPPSGRSWPTAGTPGCDAADLLPAETGRAWRNLQETLRDDVSPGLASLVPWLNGPPAECTLARYSLAERLHRAAWRASTAVAQARRDSRKKPDSAPALDTAALALAQGQSSFPLDPRGQGGLRDAASRHQAFKALGAAEHQALTLVRVPPPSIETVARSGDGHPEVVVREGALRVVVRPGLGGGLSELRLNGVGELINVLARHEEHWHDEMEDDSSLPGLVGDAETEAFQPRPPQAAPPVPIIEDDDDDYDDDEPTAPVPVAAPLGVPAVQLRPPGAPIDDLVELSDAALEPLDLPDDALTPMGSDAASVENLDEPVSVQFPPVDAHRALRSVDAGPRLCLTDRLLGDATTLDNLARGQHPELGDFAGSPYRLERAEAESGSATIVLARDGRVESTPGDQRLIGLIKRITIPEGSAELRVNWELWNRSREPIQSTFAVELNFGLDGVLAADRVVNIPGNEPIPLDTPLEAEGVRKIALDLGAGNVVVELQMGEATKLWQYPVFVPRRTPDGIAPAWQGTCVVLAWPLVLWGEEHAHKQLTIRIQTRS